MSGGLSQSRRTAISLSRLTDRLDEQERELRELKEECRCLTQKLADLEKWKATVEAWMTDHSGERLGSEEETHDDNDEVLETGKRDEKGLGSVICGSHSPAFSSDCSDVGDSQVDCSDVGGSMAVGVGGRRDRSPQKEVESPQRKRSKRDDEGSGVIFMRTSPRKKANENEVGQLSSRNEVSRSRRGPKAGTMLRAINHNSSSAVPNRNGFQPDHIGKIKRDDSDTEGSIDCENLPKETKVRRNKVLSQSIKKNRDQHNSNSEEESMFVDVKPDKPRLSLAPIMPWSEKLKTETAGLLVFPCPYPGHYQVIFDGFCYRWNRSRSDQLKEYACSTFWGREKRESLCNAKILLSPDEKRVVSGGDGHNHPPNLDVCCCKFALWKVKRKAIGNPSLDLQEILDEVMAKMPESAAELFTAKGIKPSIIRARQNAEAVGVIEID